MSTKSGRLGLHRVQPWSELDEYDRASITVDCVLLAVRAGQLYVVVHRREQEPSQGHWALPGVFVNFPEREEDAVHRALKQKAGIDASAYLERLDWSSDPDRDERGWVVTHVYFGLVPAADLQAVLPKDAARVALVPVFLPHDEARPGGMAHTPLPGDERGTRLAFDHNRFVAEAIMRLRSRLRTSSVALELVGEDFTLRELQETYEAILGTRLSRATFQRLVLEELRLVEPTGEAEPAGVGRRRAQLYRRRQL